MKTKRSDSPGTPGLPHEPAPPSRDANPWPLSSHPRASKAPPPRVSRVPRKREAGATGESRPERSPGPGWLPSLMVVFVAAVAIRAAVEAFESGNLEAAVGPLIAVAFAAFVVWRRARKRR